MIMCRALGPVDVTVDGAVAPADLLWRKNLALLVYLARSPKRARTRDHLIGLLWAEKPQSAARHSLNEALRVIRRCSDGGVETQGGQIRLAARAVLLDTEQFEERVAAADWEGACALLVGEFLEGFGVPGATEFEYWLAAERAAWRGRSVDALVRRVDGLLSRGHAAAAGECAHRALALDPVSEPAIRAALRSLALAGDRATALERYESFTARLRTELGTEPAQETAALAERVRRERVGRPAAPRETEAGAESRRAPLVGRDEELARMAGAWEECLRRPQATVALLVGDPGTGRSRLAEEFVARSRLDGAAMAAVRAVEADRREPWSGVFGLARGGLLDAPGLAGAPPAALATLVAHIPEWQDRFAGAVRGVTPHPPARALSELARAVVRERPLVLVVDDAHWLDHDSLLALGAAARDLAGTALFVLLTRALEPPCPELDELQARIGRDVAGSVVRLGPLAGGSLRALARWALPRYSETELDRLTRRVSTDSAGLPLLAVELLQAVAVGLDLDATRGAWPEPFKTLDQTLPGDLPEAVVGALRVSFHRLSADAQHVLSAAAVLGERVPTAVLGRATGLDGAALAAALDELEWRRWLSAEPRGYGFVARIVREFVARDQVTTGQRQRIEAAAGA